MFAVEPGICASRGTSGCGRGALGNSGVAACYPTTLERKPGLEREVGAFPVHFADVVATRPPFGRTGRARDSKNARREVLHGVSRHTKRPGAWLEKPFEGGLPISQYQVTQRAYTWAARSVLTVPAKNVPWLPRNAERTIFIPVGSNVPESEPQNQNSSLRSASILTVAVFGVTGGSRSCDESADISYVIRQVTSTVASLRLLVMGRGTARSHENSAGRRRPLNT